MLPIRDYYFEIEGSSGGSSGGAVNGTLIFEGVTNDNTEVLIPITKRYYANAFVGNAEIVRE